MKEFFGRKEETKMLQEIASRSQTTSQFTVLSGSRRIGKTTLVQQVLGQDNILYFYVSKKSEKDLCAIFCKEAEEKLGIFVPEMNRMELLLKMLMRYSEEHPLTVFIDEFQRFKKIDASIYDDIQKIWDLYHRTAHINLIVGGSAKTLLLKLFEDSNESLYGRQTATIKLEHFYPSVLKEILAYYAPNYTNDDLLALYCYTGGVARYVEILMDAGAFTREQMVKEIVAPSSIFLAEGKNHLIEEFGQDYGVYFAILSAIATGHTERAQIEDLVGREVGGYLTALEDVYSIVRKHQPLFATSKKNTHYTIEDNFYIFWFRYIYKYSYMLESKAYDKLQQIILNDYTTYSGKRLEQYFREKMIEKNCYTRIDQWWSRNGKSEIDLICIDDLGKKADFYEVKRQKEEYEPLLLQERKNEFLVATRELKKYSITTRGIYLEDM